MQKVVVMGRINFKDEALIKNKWVGKKMNMMGGMFKDKNKRGNHWKLFLFIVGNCECFQGFGIHKSMNAESAIKKS